MPVDVLQGSSGLANSLRRSHRLFGDDTKPRSPTLAGLHLPAPGRARSDRCGFRMLSSGKRVSRGARIRNPAFDVTPAKYVTAIITERGIFRAPYVESLARAFADRDAHA